MREQKPSHVWRIVYLAVALLLIVAAALPVYRRYARTRALVYGLEHMGGSVVMEPGKPEWLRELWPGVTNYLLDSPREVHLANSRVTDAWLESLQDFPSVEMLDLAGTGVTDAGLEHLSGRRNLKVLWLSGTQISDDGLTGLRDLPSLALMYVDDTSVSEAGVEQARLNIPTADIQW